jgi:hypothetical protein
VKRTSVLIFLLSIFLSAGCTPHPGHERPDAHERVAPSTETDPPTHERFGMGAPGVPFPAKPFLVAGRDAADYMCAGTSGTHSRLALAGFGETMTFTTTDDATWIGAGGYTISRPELYTLENSAGSAGVVGTCGSLTGTYTGTVSIAGSGDYYFNGSSQIVYGAVAFVSNSVADSLQYSGTGWPYYQVSPAWTHSTDSGSAISVKTGTSPGDATGAYTGLGDVVISGLGLTSVSFSTADYNNYAGGGYLLTYGDPTGGFFQNNVWILSSSSGSNSELGTCLGLSSSGTYAGVVVVTGLEASGNPLPHTERFYCGALSSAIPNQTVFVSDDFVAQGQSWYYLQYTSGTWSLFNPDASTAGMLTRSTPLDPTGSYGGGINVKWLATNAPTGGGSPPTATCTVAGNQTESVAWRGGYASGTVSASGTTGGANDDATLQAAVNALQAAGGGTLLIKPGNYYLSHTLTVSQPNVRICGSGFGTKLVGVADYGDVLAFIPTGGTPSSYAASPTGWEVRDLALGSLVVRTSGAGFRFDYGVHPAVDNVTNTNAQGTVTAYDGITMNSCTDPRINRVYLNCGHHGCYMNGDGVTYSNDGTIRNSNLIGLFSLAPSGACGVLNRQYNGLLVDSTNISGFDTGIYVTGGTTPTILGPQTFMDTNKTQGFYCESGTGPNNSGQSIVVMDGCWMAGANGAQPTGLSFSGGQLQMSNVQINGHLTVNAGRLVANGLGATYTTLDPTDITLANGASGIISGSYVLSISGTGATHLITRGNLSPSGTMSDTMR